MAAEELSANEADPGGFGIGLESVCQRALDRNFGARYDVTPLYPSTTTAYCSPTNFFELRFDQYMSGVADDEGGAAGGPVRVDVHTRSESEVAARAAAILRHRTDARAFADFGHIDVTPVREPRRARYSTSDMVFGRGAVIAGGAPERPPSSSVLVTETHEEEKDDVEPRRGDIVRLGAGSPHPVVAADSPETLNDGTPWYENLDSALLVPGKRYEFVPLDDPLCACSVIVLPCGSVVGDLD